MPRRNRIVTVWGTDEVQGEDAWVKVKIPLYGRAKQIMKVAKVSGEDADEMKIEITDELLIEHIVEWNWVDDEGNPLPQVKDDPTIIDSLTSTEINHIATGMLGSTENRKKTMTPSLPT